MCHRKYPLVEYSSALENRKPYAPNYHLNGSNLILKSTTTNWNEHPRPGLAVPMVYTRFLLFPLTMLIAQSYDQLFPFVGSSKTGLLLDRVYLGSNSGLSRSPESLGGAITYAGRSVC